jgi:uncharacterized alkaline shock family protein YloU
MKFLHVLHGLMKFIILISLLALGIFFLTDADVFGVPSRIGRFLLTDTVGKFVTGTLLILMVILYWLTAIGESAKEQFLSFETEGGSVNIRVKAVNEFLKRLADEFADILNLRADISAARDGRIEVQLDIDVKSGTKIQQLSQVLQQRVRESMRDGLGIPEITSIKVNVDQIIQGDKPRPETSGRADWQDASV